MTPDLALNNGLSHVQVGHLGTPAILNPFPVGPGDNPAYLLVPPGVYLIDNRKMTLSYPRKPSAFLDELQLYAAQPMGPYSSTIAPKRLADNAGWRSLLLRNQIDVTNRVVSTGVFQQWIRALWRDFPDPVLGQDLFFTNLSFYTKATSLESYTTALNIQPNEHTNIKSRRPYFFNHKKLWDIISRWGGANPIVDYQMYLVLASETLGGYRDNVIFVDVSDHHDDYHTEALTTTDVTIFNHAKFFTIMSTQHPLEEMVLTHVLYPHSQPELDTVDNNGDVEPIITPRKGITHLEYNGLDHLCHLMDTLQEPIQRIEVGDAIQALSRNSIFFYVRYFMKAFTVSSLGLPYPHVVNNTTDPNLAPLPTTFCSPFMFGNRTALRNKRFFFMPWEFLIAMGGTLAGKIKLIHAPNAPSSDPSDSETELYHTSNGTVLHYPKMPTNRFVLPAAERQVPQANNRTYYAKSQAIIVHRTAAELFRPLNIMDKRRDFDSYSAYSLGVINIQFPTLRNYRMSFEPPKVNGSQFNFLDLKNLLDQ